MKLPLSLDSRHYLRFPVPRGHPDRFISIAPEALADVINVKYRGIDMRHWEYSTDNGITWNKPEMKDSK
jgi:hypothetical protein